MKRGAGNRTGVLGFAVDSVFALSSTGTQLRGPCQCRNPKVTFHTFPRQKYRQVPPAVSTAVPEKMKDCAFAGK